MRRRRCHQAGVVVIVVTVFVISRCAVTIVIDFIARRAIAMVIDVVVRRAIDQGRRPSCRRHRR